MKFFRSIRSQLLGNENGVKYLKYALGEILLVVLGILIAIQINNWNEVRLKNGDLQAMLKAVEVENQTNIKKLDSKIKEALYVRATLISLLANMGEDYATKDKALIDSLLYEGLSMTLFDPNKAAFLNLIGSNNIKYIKNDSLRNIFLEWNSKLEALKNSQATTLNTFKTIILPHFYDKISLVSIDRKFANLNENLPRSAFKYDNRKVLSSLVTENILEDHLYNLRKVENRFAIFYKDFKIINQLIDKELK